MKITSVRLKDQHKVPQLRELDQLRFDLVVHAASLLSGCGQRNESILFLYPMVSH